jgi:hypothetical protein
MSEKMREGCSWAAVTKKYIKKGIDSGTFGRRFNDCCITDLDEAFRDY